MSENGDQTRNAWTDGDEVDLERLAHRPMKRFPRHVVELQPGDFLDHDHHPWHEAIVFLLAGELEIECSRGDRHCFRAGDVLTLARLPIRRARNSGKVITRLLVIWRKRSTSPIEAESQRTMS